MVIHQEVGGATMSLSHFAIVTTRKWSLTEACTYSEDRSLVVASEDSTGGVEISFLDRHLFYASRHC